MARRCSGVWAVALTVSVLDIVRVLDEVPPPLLPEQLIAEAMRIARGSFRAS